MSDKMIVEVIREKDWKVIEFSELEIGDRFRMRHPDTNEIFIGARGSSFIVVTRPSYNSDNTLSVTTIPFKGKGRKTGTKEDRDPLKKEKNTT